MEISLRELLDSDFFRDSEVLAGEKGLANKVTSVNVLDAPDGPKYMKAGALVVTTAYSLLNNPEDQLTVIEKLAEKKVAALGIKLRFFNYRLPEIMKKRADELGLPIISISNEYAYADILEFLMGNLLLRQTKTFLHKDKVYEQLISSAESDGLQGVAQLLHKWTGLAVALFFEGDSFYAPAAFLPENFLECSSYWQSSQLSEYDGDLKECICHYGLEVENELWEWIGADLRCRNKFKGHLFLFKGQRPFDKNDYVLLDFALRACKMEMQKIISLEQERQKHKSQYFEQLFQGLMPTREEAMFRAKELKWVLPVEAQVVYIQVAGDLDCFDMEVVEAVNGFWQKNYNTQVMTAVYGCGIVALVPASLPNREQVSEKLIPALGKKFPNLDFCLGVGRTAVFKEFKKSFAEARHAVEIGLSTGSKERVCRFDRLGVYRLLFITKSPDEIQKFYEDYLEPVIAFDRKNKTELAGTLKIFLANGCNYSLTAKQLFLHPNSIRYRLQTIEKICKVNLKSEEDRLSIAMAYKLAPLIDRPQSKE